MKLEKYWDSPDEHRMMKRQREARNPEKYRAIHKAAEERLKLRDPTYHARKARAYEARKCNAVPIWANKQRMDDMYVLANLATKLTGVKHHVDHLVPLKSNVVCGLHNEFNLRVIPGSENSRKGNRHWPDMP